MFVDQLFLQLLKNILNFSILIILLKDDEKLKTFEDKINLCIIPEVSKNKQSYDKFIKENNNILVGLYLINIII